MDYWAFAFLSDGIRVRPVGRPRQGRLQNRVTRKKFEISEKQLRASAAILQYTLRDRKISRLPCAPKIAISESL
jgi:hypothetical protein